MKIHHHPSDELLLDYASGALGEAWSLAVATHLAYCSRCRDENARLETIGGVMLSETPQEPTQENAFDQLMARLDDDLIALDTPETPKPTEKSKGELPNPLREYLGGGLEDIRWRRLGLGASQFVLPLQDKSATVRMLRIPAGKPVPEHTHNGLELTLVLKGSFADKTGTYGPGDLQEADESLDHQPHAGNGEDCICLAITDAPLRFKSAAARLIQPLLGI